MKKNIIIPFLILFSLLSINGQSVYADEKSIGDNLSEELSDSRMYLEGKKSSFQVKEFVVTHYTPLDSAREYDADSTKRLGPKKYSPVQWYKEGDQWVFSAATEYRQTVALKKLRSKYSSTFRENIVDNHKDKKVYEMVFKSGVEIPEGIRSSVLPLRCAGDGMNYSGSPWSGSSGKIPKTGMIAADRGVLPEGTEVFVEGYGRGLVGDVGGAIKGLRLDLVVNNCELALTNGKATRLVAFDIKKAKINGSTLGNKEITRLLAKGIYADEKSTNDDGDVTGNSGIFGKSTDEYSNPFLEMEMQIKKVGVDDKRSKDFFIYDYAVSVFGSKIALFLFRTAQVGSVFVIGFISLMWLLASMAFMNMVFANEWLKKISFGNFDVLTPGGFRTLGIYTGFTLLVTSIIITGTTPKVFAFVYSMLQQLIEFLSRLSFTV